MKQLSLAIIGAGVAGLTFATQLSRMHHMEFTIFQCEKQAGGRLNTAKIQHNVFADMGANIIDFQNENQEKKIRHFLKTLNKQKQDDNLRLLNQPFLIYQHQLKKGDYNKNRYFFELGFKQLVADLSKQIQHENFEYDFNVDRIKKTNNKWVIINQNNKQFNKNFDFVVFAMNGPAGLTVLKNSKLQNMFEIENMINEISYTTQISLAFQLFGAPQFSCILFKDHPITFMSSHSEKYSENAKKIVVIQLNNQVSVKLFGQTQQQIIEAFRLMLPLQMENWIGQPLAIKKWNPSLIKHKKTLQLMSFQKFSDGLLIVGDIVKGSSRVTGAMQSSLDVFEALTNVFSSKI